MRSFNERLCVDKEELYVPSYIMQMEIDGADGRAVSYDTGTYITTIPALYY